LPFTGQSVALIHDIAPADELIRRIMTQAEDALRGASGWIAPAAD
jgi:hypothetical protein